MRSQWILDFCFLTVLIIFCLTKSTNANTDAVKSRRAANGPMGLIAFPRVGRRDPSLPNEVTDIMDDKYFEYPSSSEEYSDLTRVGHKRSALFNQPRVGRNDINMFDTHRVSRTAQSMFNTPRIGRSDPEMQKYIKLMALQQLLEKRNLPSARTGMWFGPRLGKRYSHITDGSTLSPLKNGQDEDY